MFTLHRSYILYARKDLYRCGVIFNSFRQFIFERLAIIKRISGVVAFDQIVVIVVMMHQNGTAPCCLCGHHIGF